MKLGVSSSLMEGLNHKVRTVRLVLLRSMFRNPALTLSICLSLSDVGCADAAAARNGKAARALSNFFICPSRCLSRRRWACDATLRNWYSAFSQNKRAQHTVEQTRCAAPPILTKICEDLGYTLELLIKRRSNTDRRAIIEQVTAGLAVRAGDAVSCPKVRHSRKRYR